MKVLVVVPILAGFITSFLCPMSKSKNTDSNVLFRPPPYVFGIVWPILYLLIGYSWYLAECPIVNLLFIINTFLCCLWLVLYSCLGNRIYALYDLFLLQLSNLFIIFYLVQIGKFTSIYLLLPYAMWIIFAILLSINNLN